MDEPARLKWQCRRGTKELDFLLNRYLETGYRVADDGEQALFVELLRLEDDELSALLIGEMEAPEEMTLLIRNVLCLSSAATPAHQSFALDNVVQRK